MNRLGTHAFSSRTAKAGTVRRKEAGDEIS